MSASLRSVVAIQGDTLEGLALAHLGAVERWREIAALNHLRAPYLSDRPADWFGPPLVAGFLAAPLAAGATSLAAPGERADSIPKGAALFLDGAGADGYAWEAPPILGYDETTGTLTLDAPTALAWAAGTRYRVCATDLGTVCAKPGDTLLLPVAAGSAAPIVGAQADLVSLYGRDLLVGPDGRLATVGGDLATVAAVANAGQALRFRATLVPGESLLHPTEGNRTHELIGSPQGDATAALAQNYTRAALATDSRVAAIPSVVVAPTGPTSLAVTATVTLAGSSQQVRIDETVGG